MELSQKKKKENFIRWFKNRNLRLIISGYILQVEKEKKKIGLKYRLFLLILMVCQPVLGNFMPRS